MDKFIEELKTANVVEITDDKLIEITGSASSSCIVCIKEYLAKITNIFTN